MIIQRYEKLQGKSSCKWVVLICITILSTKHNLLWDLLYQHAERMWFFKKLVSCFQYFSASPNILGIIYKQYIYSKTGMALVSANCTATDLCVKTLDEIAKVSMMHNGKTQSILVLLPKKAHKAEWGNNLQLWEWEEQEKEKWVLLVSSALKNPKYL